jgi:hypothetical protein
MFFLFLSMSVVRGQIGKFGCSPRFALVVLVTTQGLGFGFLPNRPALNS